MIKASYHNHSIFSDGLNTTWAMVEKAVASGFTDFAITDHVYDRDGVEWSLGLEDYDVYIEELYDIKKRYEGKLNFLCGIEADWFFGEGTAETGYDQIKSKLEFTVGSVHYLVSEGRRYLIDGKMEEFDRALNEGYGGDIKLMVENYYESYDEMLRLLKPTLAAHPDIIRKNCKGHFTGDEKWYEPLIEACASSLKKYNMVTEINQGGNYRYKNGVIYPQDRLIDAIVSYNAPITVGLDAHSVDMVDSYYADSIDRLKKRGVKALMRFIDGAWQETDIGEWA